MQTRILGLLFGVVAMFEPCGASLAAQPLTPEQAACEELQLERLERRFEGTHSNSSILLWRASPGGGRFEGLFATQGISLGPFERTEEQLSFEIFFKTDALLLNPARLPLTETTLVRRDVESTVRLPNPAFAFDVSFEAAGGAINPFYPRVPVQISGVLAERSATRVGRGPAEDNLLGVCAPRPTAADVRILRILARTLRPTCWSSPSCPGLNFHYKVTLLRSAEAFHYRANIYPYLPNCEDDDPPGTICPYFEAGRIALDFAFTLDSAGKLQTGSVRVLPACAEGQVTGCTGPGGSDTGIFILPPIWAGQETQGPEALARGARLVFIDHGSPGNILSANLDWAALLRDTVWNEGFE